MQHSFVKLITAIILHVFEYFLNKHTVIIYVTLNVSFLDVQSSMYFDKHMHKCYEIIFYRKGIGKFYFFEGSIPILPGKFIVIPPNTVHSSKYTEEAETIYIKGDFNHIFSFSSPTVVMDDKKNGKFLVDLIFESRFSNSECGL